ncbi:hypothetical protein LEP1GSC073_1988 [Leptospira noguchii str. Cascata]|nr:hypothetical protein LEP1GSC072_3535 [Leptospira noguchii str. Bonito]EMS85882.1 hypothetical protein LEP1GSC073_1988 [Leptospira noguchii str. Cascata]
MYRSTNIDREKNQNTKYQILFYSITHFLSNPLFCIFHHIFLFYMNRSVDRYNFLILTGRFIFNFKRSSTILICGNYHKSMILPSYSQFVGTNTFFGAVLRPRTDTKISIGILNSIRYLKRGFLEFL